MMKSRSLNRKMNVFEPCSTLFRISESCSLSVLVESIFMMKNLFHVCEFRLFFHPILFSTPSSSRWIRVRRIILSFHFRETSLKKGKKERNRCSRSRLFSVYELLRELGGYLPPKSIAPADITPLVSRLLRVNGAPLFDFFVDVDLYDRSRSSVFLDLPTKRQEDAFFAENPVSVSPLQHNLFTHTHTRTE